MAFWGAPLKDNNHAQHALEASLDMQIALIKLQEEFKERQLPEIQVGIGLNSGIMSVGNMGSKFRRNYTVLGDAVNLGSRVEGLTKYYGVKIIATETTQQNQKDIIFRQLDKVRVKGKKSGVSIYEVICRRHELTDALRKELELSQLALEYYFKQQWQESHDLFSQLHREHPDVVFYQIYLNRLIAFEVVPPPPDWNGVYVHTSK
jgi:adenylate cyclase